MHPAIRVIAAAPLAGLLLAAPASASPAVKVRVKTIGICTAQGDYAVCTASGTVTRPLSLRIWIDPAPSQQVSGSWTVTCSKGMGAGSKSGSFSGSAPGFVKMHMPYRHPSWCSAAATAQLSGSGKLKLWINATKRKRK